MKDYGLWQNKSLNKYNLLVITREKKLLIYLNFYEIINFKSTTVLLRHNKHSKKILVFVIIIIIIIIIIINYVNKTV